MRINPPGPYRRSHPIRKVLVPLLPNCNSDSAITLAKLITKEVTLAGLVPNLNSESLSAAALTVRRLRTQTRKVAKKFGIRHNLPVLVANEPWTVLDKLISEQRPDLLILEWPCHLKALQLNTSEVIQFTRCDIALVCSPILSCPEDILIAVRGGQNAELAVRIGLSARRNCAAELTALHLVPHAQIPGGEGPYRGLRQVLERLPEIQRLELHTNDPAQAILETSSNYDLLIMGASLLNTADPSLMGPIVERIVNDNIALENPTGVVIVKSARPIRAATGINLADETGQSAISVLVDKWFAENTYHANEFANLEQLLELKREKKTTISLALPALNEEKTVGKVITTLKSALMDEIPLLDEIVLIDSNSTDRTRQIAADLGVPVYIHQQLLPAYGPRRGKGEALWKSLLVTTGDILLWIDTDIVNIHPRFIYGLIGPMLSDPRVLFIKGFYRRPLRVGDKIQAGGGGRVTELTARPLINLFYPELSGIIQPLSGEYGGRRSALEQIPFYSGYGVEIGLLIDILEKFGLQSIAQVDLKERIHHNQPLEALSKMSFAIIQAVTRKLERRIGSQFLEEMNKTMKLIRYEPGRFFLDVEEIAERERPPMYEVNEYQKRFSK